MDKKIELLAPAGDLERLKVTLLYGADAVYLGGEKYGLRANAVNFSLEELKEGCTFAHKLGKKVYFTLNIVFHNNDMEGVYNYMEEVVKTGIDAFIVSDPFIISYIKKKYPQIEVHLSTQNSTTNYETVNYFKKEGINRIVLARELSKKEIKEIIDKTGVEIEIFIHGAMCTCFSGRCALSNYVTNRDANRGGCSQVCRFNFKTDEEDFTMASKDLCLAEEIKEIIDIKVTSLKVEGRMRSIYYIATVIYEYRKLIDLILSNKLTNSDILYSNAIINRCANRDSVPQFYDKTPSDKEQYYLGREEVSNQDFLGIVLKKLDNKRILVEERNFFQIGDEVEFFGPGIEPISYKINKIYDEDMNPIEVARHPRMHTYLDFTGNLPVGSMMRLKAFDKSMYL